jgi:hypothetical protein
MGEGVVVRPEQVSLESETNRGRQSYERGWSMNPVQVSCSLSTRMQISITAQDLGLRH